MGEKYHYESGAIHHDHHKEINIGTVSEKALGALLKDFFKDDAEDAVIVEELTGEAENSREEEMPGLESPWDCIFHDALDVGKIKAVLPSLQSEKVDGIKRWFVIHKVLEEIDWLTDKADSHFILWVRDVYGWEWKTTDFKSVLPDFKKKSSLEWDAYTVKDEKTSLAYRALADSVRSAFVDIKNGKIVDKTCFLRRPDLYIYHPKNGR